MRQAKTRTLWRRSMAFALCFCMVVSTISGVGLFRSIARAAGGTEASADNGPTVGATRQADPSTLDQYKSMLDFSANTRYAGRLWSDKSVFALGYGDTGDRSGLWNANTGVLTLTQALDGVDGTIDINEDFLHVFSALGSSLRLDDSIKGPYDVVILLDMSGSMAAIVDNTQSDRISKSRIGVVLDSINTAIKNLMDMHATNRVAVIGYGTTACTLMELGHYLPGEDGTYLKAEDLSEYDASSIPAENTYPDKGGSYTVHVNAKKESTLGNEENVEPYEKKVRNSYLTNGTEGTTLIGFHTNLQAGIWQGFNELYKNLDEDDPDTYSYTYKSKLTGEETTIPRVPVAFVMTDGGSNLALGNANSVSGDEWHNVPIKEDVAGESSSYNWYVKETNRKYRSENLHSNAPEGSGVILDILLTASYMKSKIINKYNTLLDKIKDSPENAARMATWNFSIHSISVDTPDTVWQVPRVYATLDPKEYFNSDPPALPNNVEWKQKKDVTDAYDSWLKWKEASKTRTPIYAKVDADINGGGDDWQFKINTLSKEQETAEGVTNQDVINNINYNDSFADITAGGLSKHFEELIGQLGQELFSPVGGTNDLGVDDAVTYMDPIGKYMDVKDVTNLSLFGTLYTIVKTAVYDYQWNHQYMLNQKQENVALTDGWYKGDPLPDDNSGVQTYDGSSGYYPDGCDTIEEAWAAGWVYRVNYLTASRYVPTLANINNSAEPDATTAKQQHTVYTFYRIAGTSDGDPMADNYLTALHMNPAYGDAVPATAHPYDEENQEHLSTPGVYALIDIRIWVEDSGDYSVADTGATLTDNNYDEALWVNIPVNMLPLRRVTVIAGDATDEVTYSTNIPEAGKTITENSPESASFPLRIFYTVGVSDEVLETSNRVNIAEAISAEYIKQNKVTTTEANTVRGIPRGNLEFFSNWYNPLNRYSDYATSATDYTFGDPVVSFSPNTDNRYYVFEKALPLYKAAYRYNGREWQRVRIDGDPLTKDLTENVYDTSATGFRGGRLLAQDLEGDASGIPTQLSGKSLTPQEGDIVFLKSDRLTDVNRDNPEGDPFPSDGYYFLAIEYYNLSESTATRTQYAITRRGSEFGSGYGSAHITNGDMLCWHDMSGAQEDQPYKSFTETSDPTRGKPITPGDWVLCAKKGGLRVGDLAQNVQGKGGNYELIPQDVMDSFSAQRYPGDDSATGLSWGYYEQNVTRTSNNYYLPTISTASSLGEESDVIVNVYLGNNGRLYVMDTTLLVTKTVEPEEDMIFDKDKEFNFQIFIADYEEKTGAVVALWNEDTKTWQRQFHYIDLELDEKLFLQAQDSSRAMVDSEGKQVVTDASAVSGYKYADGTPFTGGDGPYYVFIGKNSNPDKIGGSNTGFRVYHNDQVDGVDTVPEADVTSAIDEYGRTTYCAAKVWLVPVSTFDTAWADKSPIEDGFNIEEGGLYEKTLPNFDLLTLEPPRAATGSTEITVSSPYRTVSTYWTKEIVFGVNSNKDGDGKEEGNQELTAEDLYDKNGIDGVSQDNTYIAQHTAEFTLKDGEALLFSGIRANYVYRVTEKLTQDDLDAGYSLKRVNETQLDYPCAMYSLSGRTSISEETANYVNTFEPGTLSVTKELEPENDLTADDRERDFTFTLTLTEPDPSTGIHGPADGYPYTIKSGEDVVRSGRLVPSSAEPSGDDIKAEADGTWKFTLKGGQTLTVEKLPGKTAYTVAEASVDGFRTDVQVNEEAAKTALSASGTIRPGDKNLTEVLFTNVKDKPALLSLHKTLHMDVFGGARLEGQFVFTVTPDGGNDETSDPIRSHEGFDPDTGVLTLTMDFNTDEAVDGVIEKTLTIFDDDEFTREGTYTYTIAEKTTDIPGMTYDDRVYTAKVVVTKEPASGKNPDQLKAALTLTLGGDEVETLAFVNDYDVAKTEQTFSVKKELTDAAGDALTLKGGEFSFTLTAGNCEYNDTVGGTGTSPMPEGVGGTELTVKNGADGSVSFGKVEFTRPGTYHYTVKEVVPASDAPFKYDYDETEYTVTVEVKRESDGSFTPTVTCQKTGAPETATDSITFKNTVHLGGLTVSKTVTGESGERERAFNFTVTFTNADGTTPADDAWRKYAEVDGDHTWTGNVLSFTLKDGEKLTVTGLPEGMQYTVREEDLSKDHYKIEYTNESGVISDNANVEASVTNIAPDVTVVPLQLEKTLTLQAGSDGVDVHGVFTFTVTPAAGNPADDPLHGAVRTLSTKDITIDEHDVLMIFTEADVFRTTGTPYIYTVKEERGSIPGVNYDSKVYTVKVEMEAEYDESHHLYVLVPTVTVTDSNGNVELHTELGVPISLSFENTYSAYEITASIEAHKTLKGGVLREGEFRFELTAGTDSLGNPSPMPEGTVGSKLTGSNDAGGLVSFGAIRYTEPGEYTYTLREIPGGDRDIDYDGTVYSVVVTVERTDTGALAAKVTYNGGDGAEFINTQETGGLTVSKTVTGIGNQDKEFRFTVTFTPVAGLDGAIITKNGRPLEAGIVNGVLTFTLKHGEYVEISGLPAGTNYQVTEDDYTAEGYTTTPFNADGVIPSGGTVNAEFVNDREESRKPGTGNLMVSKTVIGEGDPNKEFHFTVTLNGTSVDGISGGEITGQYGDLYFTNGTAEFTLRHGQSVVATDLPAGITYVVTEDDYTDDGYRTSVDGEPEGIIPKGGTAEARYINDFGKIVEPEVSCLKVTKTVTGLAGDLTRDWHFTVTLYREDGTVDTSVDGVYGDMTFIKGVANLTLKSGQSALAGNLPVGDTYTVEEAEANEDGYDTTVTGGTGLITGTGTANADFINRKDPPPEEKTGNLTVTKTVSGEAGDRNREFNFTVTLSGTASDGTNASDVTGTYGGMTFRNGVARFTLKDSQSRTANGLPAGLEYTVTETEADADGYHTASSGTEGTIPDGGTARADFVNSKSDKPGPNPGNLTVTKTVSGNSGELDREWHFTVTLSAAVSGNYGGMTFVNGVAEFTLKHGESLTATGLPAGVTYTVTETEANRDGYTTEATGETGAIPEGGTVKAQFINSKDDTPPPTEPSDTPTEPSDTPTEPSDTPTEPSDTPTEPSDTPTEPSDTPTEPSDTPTEPSDTPTEPSDTPTEPDTPPEIPKTGDDSHLGLWAAMMILSLAGVAVTSFSLFGKRSFADSGKWRIASLRGKHKRK